jgi:hypothetical protein
MMVSNSYTTSTRPYYDIYDSGTSTTFTCSNTEPYYIVYRPYYVDILPTQESEFENRRKLNMEYERSQWIVKNDFIICFLLPKIKNLYRRLNISISGWLGRKGKKKKSGK